MYKISCTLAFIILLCSGFVHTVRAEEAPHISTKKSAPWIIGVDVYKESYKETVNNKPFMREDATMFSLTAGLQTFFSNQMYLAYLLRMSIGSSDYTGALQGQPYGSLRNEDISRSALDFRVLAGYITQTKFKVTPYGGLGYRTLTDDLHEIGDAGYKRESHYIYAISGVSGTFLVKDNVQLTPYAQLNYLITGKQNSYMYGNDYEPLTHQQNKGYGFELGIPVSLMNAKWKVTPFYRYWRIADSEEVLINGGRTITQEPNNTTKEIGISVNYYF